MSSAWTWRPRGGIPGHHRLARLAARGSPGQLHMHRKALRLLICAIASLPMVTGSVEAFGAGDAKAGRAKALMCQACHGMDGMSKVPDAPNIAGQNEGYLVTQLQAFKSGGRKNEAMSVVTATLSDSDIDNVAAYFAAIEIKVVKLPAE